MPLVMVDTYLWEPLKQSSISNICACCVCSDQFCISSRSLLEGMGLNEDDLPAQMDTEKWVSKHHTIHIRQLLVFGCDHSVVHSLK